MSLVSIVLPIFNAERYLKSAMSSLLSQTFRDVEVIAVDDGSTDRSSAILAEFRKADSRVHAIARPNTGIVGALNDGISVARGDFVARMDADDICLPRRIEKQVGFLMQNPKCLAVGSDVLYTDPEGDPLMRHYPAQDHETIVSNLLNGDGGAIVHPSVMFRKEGLIATGGYRARYEWIEDLDLFLRLSDAGRLANLPDVHLHYRQHLQSVNHLRRDRIAMRMELVNCRRLVLGLPPLKCERPESYDYCEADFRRHWAYDAAKGGNWTTARKNALNAMRRNPCARANWRCLRYVITSSLNRKARYRQNAELEL